MGSGLAGHSAWALAIDPVTPSTLYAGTDHDGVYKSTDGGAGWGLLAGFGPVVLAVDPVTPTTLYAGTDGGAMWNEINVGLPSGSNTIAALAIDSVTPRILYVGLEHTGGVYKSGDGGSCWAALNNGLVVDWISSIEINPLSSSTLYAGTSGGAVVDWTQLNYHDADRDGVLDSCDICEGDDSTGDYDGDGICADRDCDDDDQTNACAIFEDDFESGSTSAWSYPSRSPHLPLTNCVRVPPGS